MQDSRIALVVDDSDLVRELICEFLADDGYEVVSADTAKSARSLLQTVKPDLCILDFFLGDEDGGSLAAAIREVYPAARVVIVSGILESVPCIVMGGTEVQLVNKLDLVKVLREIAKESIVKNALF